MDNCGRVGLIFDSLRETAESFPIHRAGYIFDLDFMVSGSQNGYSVDAYQCGEFP